MPMSVCEEVRELCPARSASDADDDFLSSGDESEASGSEKECGPDRANCTGVWIINYNISAYYCRAVAAGDSSHLDLCNWPLPAISGTARPVPRVAGGPAACRFFSRPAFRVLWPDSVIRPAIPAGCSAAANFSATRTASAVC